MTTMVGKTRELGTATLAGLVVGAVLSMILGVANAPVYSAIGSFIGGIVAAYFLRGKLSQAVIAGALSGILGTPFLLGLSDILAIFGLIPTPPDRHRRSLICRCCFDHCGDGSCCRCGRRGCPRSANHPPGSVPSTPTPLPAAGMAPVQVRYCVQCGAQLPSGALICPQCNARQPQ